MKLTAEFKNEICILSLTADDEWEEKLLGAIAKGGDELVAIVEYRSKGHFSYGKGKAIKVVLSATPKHLESYTNVPVNPGIGG